MKSLQESLNEARQIQYQVALIDVVDMEGIPVSATITIEKEYQKAFENWLEKEEGNTFSHAEGGNIMY